MEQRILFAVLLALLSEAGAAGIAQAEDSKLIFVSDFGCAGAGKQLKLAQAPDAKASAKPDAAAASPAAQADKPADKPAAAQGKPDDKQPHDLDNPAFVAALNKGVELFKQNKTDAALIEFQKAHEINPNNVQVLNWIGTVYRQQNKADKQAEIYERIVKLDPDWPDGHNGLGFAYQQLGRWDEAENEYATCLTLNPGFTACRFNYANVLMQERKYEEAIKEFENVIKVDPSFGKDCYLFIGEMAFETKDYSKAVDYLNKAMAESKKAVPKDNKGMAEITADLALIDKAKGDEDKFKDGIERALDLDAGSYKALLNMGIYHLDRKEYTDSLDCLAKALQRNPYDAAVHYWLGKYYFKLDSINDSLKQFSDCGKCDSKEHKFADLDEWIKKAKDRKATM